VTARGAGLGKVILLGEHAVVHGHAALAGALDRGVTVTARAADALRLIVPAWGVDVAASDEHPVATALRAVVSALGCDPSLVLEADARIPAAAGLGSSAAMAVAIARALAAAIGRACSDDEIGAIANAAERCFHANPSGVDVALAARGGLGVYRRGVGLRPIEAAPITLAIATSGETRSTAAMVERVSAAAAADPARAADLAAMGAAAEAGARHLSRGELVALGSLMTDAHRRLAALGASTAMLDLLVGEALVAGALGAKLTGAGGGGAVIALGATDAVLDAWRARGTTCFAAQLGGVESASARQ
jgi:mevalonate kinase